MDLWLSTCLALQLPVYLLLSASPAPLIPPVQGEAATLQWLESETKMIQNMISVQNPTSQLHLATLTVLFPCAMVPWDKLPRVSNKKWKTKWKKKEAPNGIQFNQMPWKFQICSIDAARHEIRLQLFSLFLACFFHLSWPKMPKASHEDHAPLNGQKPVTPAALKPRVFLARVLLRCLSRSLSDFHFVPHLGHSCCWQRISWSDNHWDGSQPSGSVNSVPKTKDRISSGGGQGSFYVTSTPSFSPLQLVLSCGIDQEPALGTSKNGPLGHHDIWTTEVFLFGKLLVNSLWICQT